MKAISLMYHDVVERDRSDASGFPGADAALYKLDRGQFQNHLRAIAKAVPQGPISLLNLTDIAPHEPTPLLLTFDDGGKSAFTFIADTLEEVGWRGHFFIAANYIDTPSFVSAEEIRELKRRGHIIGSHSSSHPLRMSNCSWDEMYKEWTTSIQKLSDIVGERVSVASVPGGHYSDEVGRTASLAGIERLFTSEPVMQCWTVDNCLVLGRYTIQRWMSPMVAADLASGKIAPRVRQYLFWNAKKASKAVGGRYYLKIRRSLFRTMT